LALILAAILLFTASTPAVATGDKTTDVLFVVKDATAKESVLTYSNISEYKNDVIVEVVTQNEFQSQKLPKVKAIAIPETIADITPVSSIYNSGIRLYMYGDLTINDYIAHSGQKDFSSKIPVFNPDGSFSGDYVKRNFDEEQRNEKQYQIICSPKDDSLGLLCTIDKQDDGNKLESYLNIITEDYINTKLEQRNTIVSSDYNIVHYYYNDACAIHLTWILYRNYNEEDVNYDYFALESRIWGTTNSSAAVIQTNCEHEMYYPSDHIIDSGPESTSSANSLSFALEFDRNGISGGSITFNLDLDSSPNITQDTSNYDSSVSWMAQKRLFGPALNDDIFKFATTWASTGTLAKININYSNSVSVASMGVGIAYGSGVLTETISFDY